MKSAHELLKDWREGRKLTQAQASRLADVSQATWCEWEAGGKIPRIDLAVRLEELTDSTVTVRDWAAAMGDRKSPEKGDAA